MTGPARSAHGRDLRGLLDGAGRVLLAIGGIATAVVVPFAILVVAVLGTAFAIGFASDTERVAAEGDLVILVAIAIAILTAIGGFALLALGLRGRVWALAILLVVGVGLALLNNPFPQRLGPDFRRPEDISFTAAQLAVALLPATMALGAALRLIARVPRG